MKLRPWAAATALGIMGIVYMLVVNYYPMLSEAVMGTAKGEMLRAMMEDIYPYYDHTMWHAPLVGSICGFLDAFFFGLITSWLYNSCLCSCSKCCCEPEIAKAVPKKAVSKKAATKTITRKTTKKRTTTRKKK